MRSTIVAFVVLGTAACGTDASDGPQSTSAFKVSSSPFELLPGTEVTKCFYFHTPNTEALQINKWVSDMTPGSHHMIVFASLGTQPADGVVDDCDGADIPVPIYGTQIPHEVLQFPIDDGFGKPLAQQLEPNTAGFFQMHYNNDIAIPPNAIDYKVSATCDIFDKKFWQMSSHSHKQSMTTTIKDGDNVVFTSDDWEHPGVESWDAPTYYQFQGTSLTWECTYNNTGDNKDRTVTSGQSARTDEMCMATGYFFPAAGPRGCFMNNGQCQCLL